ncbi:ribulose bisphosphate carboxylase small subunit, chloroplastic-like isoform X2 [Lycium barbarum]|uniref:ribulose bisphosphate carboxylase small subunit, chloroplastic-like isoform X2 n=1 Tax=Lycium barbarum TaxID=112863 RepID=UPI00293F1795|nr:ribulose bisphosphate carboxylase small subunit, chloroplastic-like isoform X2 [Lycium barbarum]
MASSMISSAAVATRTNVAQTNMVAPFTGLKSAVSFPVSRKQNLDITSIASNGGRVQCMQVWPPINMKKYETLSYLPDLSDEQLLKEIEYLLKNGWVPCLEFDTDLSTVRTTRHQDTMMAGTGQCGSCPCLGALMPPRSWLRSERPRRLTHRPGSELSDSTTFVKCSASVSLPTSQKATKFHIRNNLP